MDDGNASRDALAKEAARIGEDALYSSKGHFEAASGWRAWHLRIGIPSSIAAAVAGVSVIKDWPEVAATLAFMTAAATAVSTFLDAKGHSAAHLGSGNAFKALHSDARIFEQIDCPSSKPTEDLRKQLEALSERRHALNGSSPQIPRWAYESARRGIEEGEADYQVDKSS